MGLFEASMRTCDDCDRVGPLAWFGRCVRVCAACRDRRLADQSLLRAALGDPLQRVKSGDS